MTLIVIYRIKLYFLCMRQFYNLLEHGVITIYSTLIGNNSAQRISIKSINQLFQRLNDIWRALHSNMLPKRNLKRHETTHTWHVECCSSGLVPPFLVPPLVIVPAALPLGTKVSKCKLTIIAVKIKDHIILKHTKHNQIDITTYLVTNNSNTKSRAANCSPLYIHFCTIYNHLYNLSIIFLCSLPTPHLNKSTRNRINNPQPPWPRTKSHSTLCLTCFF